MRRKINLTKDFHGVPSVYWHDNLSKGAGTRTRKSPNSVLFPFCDIFYLGLIEVKKVSAVHLDPNF